MVYNKRSEHGLEEAEKRPRTSTTDKKWGKLSMNDRIITFRDVANDNGISIC